MAQDSKDKGTRCSRCGRQVSDIELQACRICRSLFCHHCAVTGYGRDFCSEVCRGFFFYGDGDEREEDY
jgi:hypothetical protein